MILTGLIIIVTTVGPVNAASLSELKQQEEQKAVRQKEIADSIFAAKKKNDIQNGF